MIKKIIINLNLSKTQKEALIEVYNSNVTYNWSPAPFKRETTYWYLASRNFNNKTFKKLLEMNLIKHNIVQNNFCSGKAEVIITENAKKFLRKMK